MTGFTGTYWTTLQLTFSAVALACMATTAGAFCPQACSAPNNQTPRCESFRSVFYSESIDGSGPSSGEVSSGNDVDIMRVPLSVSDVVSARVARIGAPLAIAAATFLSSPLVAEAGIGTVVPVEVTLKEKFRGAIANSVIILRLSSTLRKMGYYEKKSEIASFDASPTISELAGDLTRKFGDGQTAYSLPESMLAFIEATKGKRALIVYGPEVTISVEGDVSGQQGSTDVAATEKQIFDQAVKKLLDNGVSEVCLLGGTLIRRPKTGGKAAGEDYFYPRAITIWKKTSGGSTSLMSTDLFDEVFGDLPTPRQTRILK